MLVLNFVITISHYYYFVSRQVFAEELDNGNVMLASDGMDNEAALWFQASPERIAVVHQGKLAWLGARGPVGYSTEALEKWLNAYRLKST